MKKSLVLLLACVMPLFSASPGQEEEKVRVYYFHTSTRCVNCTHFENWTREVVENRFGTELEKGLLTFHTLNIEEEENKAFIETYRLVTKSVIAVRMQDGEPGTWKNLDRIWMTVRSEEKFKDYVESEIRSMLDGAAS